MENTVVPLIEPAAKAVGEQLVIFTKCEFNAIFCFTSNIKNLEKESKKLENEVELMKKRVEECQNSAQQILKKTETWLGTAEKLGQNANEIQAESSHLNSGCFTIKSRYKLSKKAKRAIDDIKNHLLECAKLDVICVSAPPVAQSLISLPQSLAFTSRKEIEDGVMRDIKDKKANLIGICGMGGLGKTTLAKKIQYAMKESGLFDETVMVVVSQHVDLSKIQREICECLGMKDMKDSLQARAHDLHERLKGPQRTLIILDDIWKEISLEELGIKSYTVLITSRDIEVLKKMDANIFEMTILIEEEAWSLFRHKAGGFEYGSDLESIVKEVAKECKGLPLAIINVAKALKGKKKSIWENAHYQLRKSNPKNVGDVIEHVYKPLKFSYDCLNNEDAKSLLLLCSQFPEDFNIRLEDLTLYSMGLNMLDSVDNLTQARDAVDVAIDNLKSSYLLLDGDTYNTVKMHDVIRDVIRFIASEEEKLVDMQQSSRRDSDENKSKMILEFPQIEDSQFLDNLMRSNFPNLGLLTIQAQQTWMMDFDNINDYTDEVDNLCDINDMSFLEKMTQLYVLSLENISLFGSLPPGIELLKDIRTLCLYNCDIGDISIIGRLLHLEILSCVWCTNIREITPEMGELKHLKMLQFLYCKNLDRIAPNVISKFSELEELKMLGSFKQWESTKNGKERRNATLEELESLNKLKCLEIEIYAISLLHEEILLPSTVENYKITFGRKSQVKIPNKSLLLHGLLEVAINIPNWIHKLLEIVEGLYLEGDGSTKIFNLPQVQNTVKSFEVRNCGKLEALVNVSRASTSEVFCKLEYLNLKDLPNIKRLCNGQISERSISFGKLREMRLKKLPSLTHLWSPDQYVVLNNFHVIHVKECDELQNLNSLEMAKDAFLHLEEVRIQECKKMEVFVDIKHREKGAIMFPILKVLRLFGLPSLINFGKGIESVEFPLLKDLYIRDCPKMIDMVSSMESKMNEEEESLNSSFFNKKAIFGGLTKLIISDCGGIVSLFSSSVAQSFKDLKHLSVEDCENLKQLVIGDEKKRDENAIKNHREDKAEEMMSFITFPKLESLYLVELSSLRTIGKGIEKIEFPMLQILQIIRCEKLISCVGSSPHNDDYGDDPSLYLFNKAIFGGLTELFVSDCNGIVSLFSNSVVQSFENLKHLDVKYCYNLKQLVIGDEKKRDENAIENQREDKGEEMMSFVTFRKLERLRLWGLSSLRTIGKEIEKIEFPMLQSLEIIQGEKLISCVDSGPHNDDYGDDPSLCLFNKVIFGGLKKMKISCCDNIISLFSSSIPQNLINLEKLEIFDCNQLKQLAIGAKKKEKEISNENEEEEEEEDNDDDQSLDSFGNREVKFDSLKSLRVWGCEVVSIIWDQRISPQFLQTLEKLDIQGCKNIISLFSSSMVENLVHLKELIISNCECMEQVIEGEKEIQEHSILFPSLKILQLEELPVMKMLCEWRCTLESPLVEEITITNCPRIEFLTPESLSTPKLHFIKIDNQRFENKEMNEKKDLNGFLRENIASTSKQESTASLEEIE